MGILGFQNLRKGTMKLCSDMFYSALKNSKLEVVEGFLDDFEDKSRKILRSIKKR